MPQPSTPSPPADAVAPVPVMRPLLPRAASIDPYLRRIDATRWYSNFGPLEVSLRERLAERLGCPPTHVVPCASATAALHGLVAIAGPAAWEVPCFAFPAPALAVLQAGKRLRLVDIDPHTLRAGPSGKDAARIDVLPFGLGITPADLDRAGPPVIIDAAASLGAANAPLDTLRADDAVVFSLHATKPLGCGEGGVAVCGSEDLAARLRCWTNFGFRGDRATLLPGTNGKLSEYAAAVAHAALDEWPATRAAWQSAQQLVRSVGRAHGLVSLPPDPPEVSPYWIVLCDDATTARSIEAACAVHGVATRRWWGDGLHTMPAFRPLATDDYPVAESVASRCLGLPVFCGITGDEVLRIDAALRDAGRMPVGTAPPGVGG
jgi:dTDP-4-amino-4,6-dideoxygalactose transaminase